MLLKLVLRPQPIRAPSCPPTLSVPLHPNFPLSAAAAGRLTVPLLHLCDQHPEGDADLFVWMCGFLIFQTTCTQQTRISWLLKNIDYRCGYGVYFFYTYESWMSISSFTTSKIIKIRQKTIDIVSMVISFFYSDLICYRKSGRASLFSKATSILMAATRG